MSTTCTLSFHMGSRFNEKHNNRTIPVPHANTEYEKEHNWYSPDNMSLEQAYEFFYREFQCLQCHRKKRPKMQHFVFREIANRTTERAGEDCRTATQRCFCIGNQEAQKSGQACL